MRWTDSPALIQYMIIFLVSLGSTSSTTTLPTSTHPALGAGGRSTVAIPGHTHDIGAFATAHVLASAWSLPGKDVAWPQPRGTGVMCKGFPATACLHARNLKMSLNGGGGSEGSEGFVMWTRKIVTAWPRWLRGRTKLTADGEDALLRKRRSTHVAMSARGGNKGFDTKPRWAEGEVVYATNAGWLKQDSLVGKERMGEFSSSEPSEEGEDEDDLGGMPRSTQFSEHRYAFRVMYDGAKYNGWQLQPRQPSVQGLLETVLAKKLRCKVKVVGAGRTDTGVHARGQAAHFDTSVGVGDVAGFEHSLNRMLPPDVRVHGMQVAPKSALEDEEERAFQWHAIYNAVGKLYVYRFYSGETMDPLERHIRHYEYRPIDPELLEKAAREFEGTHNFAAFTNQNNKGKAAKNPVRTVHSISVVNEGQGKYRLEFLLDGALYKMVRNIMGMILAVASGKMNLDDIPGMFEEGTRCRVPQAAPAHGLCLEQVYYSEYFAGGESEKPPAVFGSKRLHARTAHADAD